MKQIFLILLISLILLILIVQINTSSDYNRQSKLWPFQINRRRYGPPPRNIFRPAHPEPKILSSADYTNEEQLLIPSEQHPVNNYVFSGVINPNQQTPTQQFPPPSSQFTLNDQYPQQ